MRSVVPSVDRELRAITAAWNQLTAAQRRRAHVGMDNLTVWPVHLGESGGACIVQCNRCRAPLARVSRSGPGEANGLMLGLVCAQCGQQHELFIR